MRASSEAALTVARQRLVAAIANDPAAARTVSGELFGVADLAHATPKVAHALTDPTRTGEDRAGLARRLLAEANEHTREVVALMASQRWSDPDDFSRAADDLGAAALALHAQSEGTVEQLQSQLFAIEETLGGHRDLRAALNAGSTLSAADRRAIARRLFADAVAPDTLALLERAIGAGGNQPVTAALARYRADVAGIEGLIIATVRAATQPSEAQLERLRRVLQARFGGEVVLNVAVEPDLVGGMRVSVGSTIFDGTIRSALDSAERVLAGKARA